MDERGFHAAIAGQNLVVDLRRDLRGIPYVDVDGRLRVRFLNGRDESVNPRFLDVVPDETSATVHDRFREGGQA